MRSKARAVVIGGGVVGVSTLYHLAAKGWDDSILLERKSLTSGSTSTTCIISLNSDNNWELRAFSLSGRFKVM